MEVEKVNGILKASLIKQEELITKWNKNQKAENISRKIRTDSSASIGYVFTCRESIQKLEKLPNE